MNAAWPFSKPAEGSSICRREIVEGAGRLDAPELGECEQPRMADAPRREPVGEPQRFVRLVASEKQSGQARVCDLAVRIFIERAIKRRPRCLLLSEPNLRLAPRRQRGRALEIGCGKFEGAHRGVSSAPRLGRGLARQKGLGEQFIGLKSRAGFDAIAQQGDRIVDMVGNGPSYPTRSPMTTDAAAQLAILGDALTEIVDLATADPKALAPPAQVLARAGDIAAEALAVAATYGRLPPFAEAAETRDDPANSKAPSSP